MTENKISFFKLEKYDGGLVKFGDDLRANIFIISSISFDDKHNTKYVYYVKGLRNNILSVRKMYRKGYNIVFENEICEIRKGFKTMIVARNKFEGNIYQLKGVDSH
jgi:hypothetical protein